MKQKKIIFWAVILLVFLVGLGQIMSISLFKDDSPLVINEFVAANGSGLKDEDGDDSDWIELYNRSSSAINLAGWSLTDDPDDPQKWRFPDVTLGSNQYLVIFASGKDRRAVGPETPLHTNFKLNHYGDHLALYDVLNNRRLSVSQARFPKQFRGVSYGRLPEQPSYHYLAHPTPGQPNDASATWTGLVEPVEFSQRRGLFNAPLQLELTTNTPNATIRYTTDGSEPAPTNGQIYSQPIPIETTTAVRAAAFKSGYLDSSVTTHTYLFRDDVLNQPANPAGFPATWGIHNRNVGDYVSGTPVQANYEMDPEIVNNPRYRQSLIAGLQAIPSLSLVTDVANLDIYANPRRRGRGWERPVSVEYFDPQAPDAGFHINAGLRIHGEVGRNEAVLKHSLRLLFRSKYGAGKLEYPLFPNSPVESFDVLVLRAGTNQSYAGRYNSHHHLTTYTRDEWARASQLEMSGLSPRGNFVHLYLNGLYWGLYNVVERPNDSYLAAHLGGQKADWYIRDQEGTVSGTAHQSILNLAFALFEAGPAGFKDPTLYQSVQTYIDTTQFSDYIILNWYIGNDDWPYNNWYAFGPLPAGPLQFLEWDAENSLEHGAEIRLQGRVGGIPTLNDLPYGSKQQFGPEFEKNPLAFIFLALIENPDFKQTFADRVYKHLFNNGALTDANAQARWQRLNAPLEQAIVAESARWGDTWHEQPVTPDDWLKARADVLAQLQGNGAKLVNLLRQADYYPPIDPPALSHPGGFVEPNFSLTLESNAGEIYYTTNGSDPRTPVTGEIAPDARQYEKPLPVTTTLHLKARTRTGQQWSALSEAIYTVVPADYGLRITEIMYNPSGGDDYEFIELQNVGDTPLDLSGMTFVDSIDYTFPANTRLAPGARLVLAGNPDAFARRYPQVQIDGVYGRRLSNAGETITIQGVQDQTVLSISYSDANGWPLTADGWGDSLVLKNIDGDPNDPKNWSASFQMYGSPGRSD